MSHWANTIHSAAMSLLQAGFGTTFKTYRITPMLQVQPEHLPVLAVHLLREKRLPDGQCNQTMPKFIHDLTLGFSGAVQIPTDEQNQIHALEEWMASIDDLLLCDPRFLNLTEGCTQMDRVGQYAKVGEITLYEIRVEMNLQFRSQFSPTIVDDLKLISIQTQFPDKAHADAGTPQLDREYEIETGP